jgi:hypothetical protein
MHAVTNGLGALPALAARWRYGTPMVVTERAAVDADVRDYRNW